MWRNGWLLAMAVALGCAPGSRDVGRSTSEVVYGTDDRQDVYAHEDAVLVAIADSATAMRVRATRLDESDPDDVRIDHERTLGEAQNLCPGERFTDQLEPGSCSGTLIDAQHVLTAGHCMDAPENCTDQLWLFGFSLLAEDRYRPLTADDVYRCGSVVTLRDDRVADYAVVRLARPVVGRTAPPVRSVPDALPVGTRVALIGHPHGIPMKIDDGGEITWSSDDASRFRATVDAFSGNSGSGTFTLDGTLVGVLSGGLPDYVDEGDCRVVNVVDPATEEGGESLIYAASALEAFCAVPGTVSPLCDCDGGACVPGRPHDRCEDAEVLAPESQVLRGTLAGYTPWAAGTCGGVGPERVYALTLPAPADLRATVSGFDTVLYLREGGCDGAELACNDDASDEERGSTLAASLPAGTVFLFVDAFDRDDVGEFTLELDLRFLAPPDMGPPPPSDMGAAEPEPDLGAAEPPPADMGPRAPRDLGPPAPPDLGPPLDAPGGGCIAGPAPSGLAALGLVLAWSRRRRAP